MPLLRKDYENLEKILENASNAVAGLSPTWQKLSFVRVSGFDVERS